MRKLYIYCGVMLCLIGACLGFLAVQPKLFPLDAAPTASVLAHETPQTAPKPSPSPEADASEAETKDTDVEEAVPYDCPGKLTEAMEKNPDVYAWLSIPNTNIDHAVVQSPDSDQLYLTRDAEGIYSQAGAIMTEHSYNGTDFEDPVTVLYGHCMKSGDMLGNMQTYYSAENGIEDHKTVEIYLPDKMLEYEVFAAVPYDTRHILYNYDFTDRKTFSSFFRSILSIRSFNANVISEERPKYGDKVLILSTCLKGDSTRRYLVMAKLK